MNELSYKVYDGPTSTDYIVYDTWSRCDRVNYTNDGWSCGIAFIDKIANKSFCPGKEFILEEDKDDENLPG
jgi:hypothetical protein